jgi:hypothetical protein
MSFPYALLHFETQQAKQRLTQVFHAGPGLRSDSLYQPLKVGRVFLDGWTSIEHAPGKDRHNLPSGVQNEATVLA